MSENKFKYVLSGLPDAELAGQQMKGPGVIIEGAYSGPNALVSVLSGENVAATAYVIGINGRGTLNIPEEEFNHLLAAMAKVWIDRERQRQARGEAI